MVSERDIMRVLAESAGAALQLSVAQVMTRTSLPAAQTIRSAAF
jgi:hypothetical protein